MHSPTSTKRRSVDDDTIMDDQKCWKCQGKGRKYQKLTKQFDGEPCGVCQGSGERIASGKAQALTQQPGIVVPLRGFPDNPGGGFAGVPAVTNKEDAPGPGEILASLGCGDWRIFQLAGGHKLTVDDFICAWVAATEMRNRRGYGKNSSDDGLPFGSCPPPGNSNSNSNSTTTRRTFRHADIGCGCGSVLMNLAWAFPGGMIRSHGAEAQAVSYELCRRGLLWNLGQDGSSPDHAVRVSLEDLRFWNGGDLAPYDLITGTPPYFPQERFVASENHAQKIRCRVPTRGTASDYIEAAARLLAIDGTFVVVETARQEGEAAIWETVQQCGLCVTKRVDVVTRTGLPPRFSCWVIIRKNKKEEKDVDIVTFTLRNNDATKSRTLEYVEAMEAMGWIDFENTRQRNVNSPK